MSVRLSERVNYFVERARVLQPQAVVERAKEVARRQQRWWPRVLSDMLWEAGTHNTNFQDYVDWDFVLLSNGERRTYLTNAISGYLAERFNEPEFRTLFEHKIKFNARFSEYLGREWFDISNSSEDELKRFIARHDRFIAKEPVSNSGYGVALYHSKDINDVSAFAKELTEKGQVLLEEYIVQHEGLAAVCPGIVNTTRVTTFLDGDDVHIISYAQKFGVGEGASDQQAFGGFFTLLDENGRSKGPGYGSHQHIYHDHPVTGASITDFVLPQSDEVLALVERACKEVPQIRYIGWDVVVTPKGPILVEGNWVPGAYENKLTATGVRTGSLPRIKQITGI